MHRRRLYYFIFIFLTYMLPSQLWAVPLLVKDVRIRSDSAIEYIEIQLSRPASYTLFTLDAPPRLVIDLPPLLWQADKRAIAKHTGSIIKNIRYARFDANTSRLVFDLAGKVEIERHGLRAADTVLTFSIKKTGRSRKSTGVIAGSGYPIPTLKPQTPNKKDFPVIAIDAGHGGGDPGAIGRGGTREKDITLKYAVALKEALLKSGKYKAILTRNNDRFIRLRERIRIARKAGADLFISLHADSAPTRQARGLSVYTLSEKASDQEAAALAAQENKADIIGGIDLSYESEDVMDILIDLAQRETKNKSIKLADILVAELGRTVRLLPNPHRFAGFAVLKAPDVPSVLLEIGFLSNPREEKHIRQKGHRKKVVKGIVAAIDKYFRGLK